MKSLPSFNNEAEVESYGASLMEKFCLRVARQVVIPKKGMRLDISGLLPNHRQALVECKIFRDHLATYVDAIDQAASYADELQHPVFIGPVYGSPSEISYGIMSNGLGALHLMASRLNVGFLWVNHSERAGLLFRGQCLIHSESKTVHPRFDEIYKYTERMGSAKITLESCAF